jgi:hypothetical protein
MRERAEAMLAQAIRDGDEIAVLAGTAIASGATVGAEVREDALMIGARIAALTELLDAS